MRLASCANCAVWPESTRRRQPCAGSDTMEPMAEHEAGRTVQTPAATPEAWRRTELARHPDRPYPMDFIEALFTDFSEIHGDRGFGDDAAMSCGMARFHGQPVLVIANLKGRT